MSWFDKFSINKNEEAKIQLQRLGYIICECIIAGVVYDKAVPTYSSDLRSCIAESLDQANKINWEYRFSSSILSENLFKPSAEFILTISTSDSKFYNFSYIKTPIRTSLMTEDCLQRIHEIHDILCLTTLPMLIPPKHISLHDWKMFIDKQWYMH